MTEIALGSVSIPRINNLRERLYRANKAVYEATGRKPTHYLVGWMTLAEIRFDNKVSVYGERLFGGAFTFDGAALILDPTRKHAIVAVPELDYLIGRELPPGAFWDGDTDERA